jgi:hypothetical protein
MPSAVSTPSSWCWVLSPPAACRSCCHWTKKGSRSPSLTFWVLALFANSWFLRSHLCYTNQWDRSNAEKKAKISEAAWLCGIFISCHLVGWEHSTCSLWVSSSSICLSRRWPAPWQEIMIPIVIVARQRDILHPPANWWRYLPSKKPRLICCRYYYYTLDLNLTLFLVKVNSEKSGIWIWHLQSPILFDTVIGRFSTLVDRNKCLRPLFYFGR